MSFKPGDVVTLVDDGSLWQVIERPARDSSRIGLGFTFIRHIRGYSSILHTIRHDGRDYGRVSEWDLVLYHPRDIHVPEGL